MSRQFVKSYALKEKSPRLRTFILMLEPLVEFVDQIDPVTVDDHVMVAD